MQLDGSFNPMFSATLQVLAKHNGEGNEKPGVEWAFGKAKLGGGFTLRAGRIGAPYFAVSDFREVGYANTWLRTPSDVYGQVFFRSFDGADLLYAGDVAGVPVTAQLLAGKTTLAYERTDIDFKNQVGVNLTAELADGVTLRMGHISGKLTVQSTTMKQLVGVLGATPFASVGQQIDCTARKASFTGVGLSVEKGNWVGSTEYTQRQDRLLRPRHHRLARDGRLPLRQLHALRRGVGAAPERPQRRQQHPAQRQRAAHDAGAHRRRADGRREHHAGHDGRGRALGRLPQRGGEGAVRARGHQGRLRPVPQTSAARAPPTPVQVLSLAVDFIF